MARILLAEDEPRIAEFVARGLRAHEFTVTVVDDGAAALGDALHGDFDLLILDIGLPGLDGYEVLDRLRGGGSTLPVLVLTARASVADTVASLDLGADDFLAKPFAFDELLARVRARVRRPVGATETVGSARDESVRVVHGDLVLDRRSRRVSVAGRSRDLSAREFGLLEMLMTHAGQVLSREQLLSGVWGYDFEPGSNIVDVYVRYLRRKIGPERIQTVRGMGYRLG